MKRKENIEMAIVFVVTFISILLFSLTNINAADPEGPDRIDIHANTTKSTVAAEMVNISGGRVATINITATIQNDNWKAFVGNVTGKFTLDDATNSTIYDWTISTITGRVYATRNSSSITWSGINCTNITHLEIENVRMNHTSADDNISKTFNATRNVTTNGTMSGNHPSFWVGSEYIIQDTCPVVHTYVDNVSQTSEFHEMSLWDGTNVVYATILEPDEGGFDGKTYDFQMIVPEIALPSFSSATAYYIYVEIGT